MSVYPTFWEYIKRELSEVWRMEKEIWAIRKENRKIEKDTKAIIKETKELEQERRSHLRQNNVLKSILERNNDIL